jgi:hypothetical protein
MEIASTRTISSAKFFALWNDEAAVFTPAFRVLDVLSLDIDLGIVMSDERPDVWINTAPGRAL